MEPSAILVYGKRPFAIYKSAKEQGCLIDEDLLLKLGIKIRRIDYSKFTLPDGRVTNCVGNFCSTTQLVNDGKASKSVTFRGKIIRDLRCDAIGDQRLFQKCNNLKPVENRNLTGKLEKNNAHKKKDQIEKTVSLKDHSLEDYRTNENNKDNEESHDEGNDN